MTTETLWMDPIPWARYEKVRHDSLCWALFLSCRGQCTAVDQLKSNMHVETLELLLVH